MSKRNRPRTPQEQLESALVNHQLPMTDSTRPDESISTPEPMGIVERGGSGGENGKEVASEEVSEVHWQPAYPCPSCFGGYGGIGIVKSTLRTIVYCKCNKCLHSFSAPRKPDAIMVNSVMVQRALV